MEREEVVTFNTNFNENWLDSIKSELVVSLAKVPNYREPEGN